MTKLNPKESILVMLIKNSNFIDEVPSVDRAGNMPQIFESNEFLLDYYSKYYNSLEDITYDFIFDFFTKELGDILFKIDPQLFKRAVEISNGIYAGSYQKRPLLESFVVEIGILEFMYIELDSEISNVLVGNHIPEITD